MTSLLVLLVFMTSENSLPLVELSASAVAFLEKSLNILNYRPDGCTNAVINTFSRQKNKIKTAERP